MYLAEIEDDCLLGVDFLRAVNLGSIFGSAFGVLVCREEKNLSCSRNEDFCVEISENLMKRLYENNCGKFGQNFFSFFDMPVQFTICPLAIELSDLFLTCMVYIQQYILIKNCSLHIWGTYTHDFVTVVYLNLAIPCKGRLVFFYRVYELFLVCLSLGV